MKRGLIVFIEAEDTIVGFAFVFFTFCASISEGPAEFLMYYSLRFGTESRFLALALGAVVLLRAYSEAHRLSVHCEYR